MKFNKILSGSILFLAASFTQTSLYATSLNGLMTVENGSTFKMGSVVVALQAGSAGGIQLGTFQNFVLNPDEPHPAGHPDAANGAGSGYATDALVVQSTALQPFNFFGVPTYVGINPLSYQSGLSKLAPSANVDMSTCVGNVCSLAVDLSAWEVFWNGSAFEQGPRPVSTGPFVLAEGTYNLATGDYVLDWVSQINGGPFNGVPASWHLEGTVVVPVPAAVWLFGSGLVALFGFARARKA